MAKNRFATCLGLMFKGEVTPQAMRPNPDPKPGPHRNLALILHPNLNPNPNPNPGQVTRQAISAICANYRAGDPDPREPGTCMQVQFKEFALDFDNFVVPKEALPQAEGELLRAMQQLRLAAQDLRLDMTDFFESYAGKGREGQLGIMPKNRFQACHLLAAYHLPLTMYLRSAPTMHSPSASRRRWPATCYSLLLATHCYLLLTATYGLRLTTDLLCTAHCSLLT